MHPAYSVLLFTTLSGAGYGLMILLCLFGVAGVVPADPVMGLIGFGLSFAMVTSGLLASAFHLGHRERAWRAVTQWRSSWLSREGVMALITYVPAGLFAIGWIFVGDTSGVWALLGVAAALGALLTVYCTGMIYQSLKTIRQWHNDWVAPVYLLLAVATGALWFNALALAFGEGRSLFTWLSVAVLALGMVAKFGYWHSIDTGKALRNPGHATGLGRLGTVRQWEPAHTQTNYVQREMGFAIARKHAHKLRVYALLAGFIVPLFLSLAVTSMANGLAAAVLAFLAAPVAMFGMLIERWLFFAEAQHVVTLYYGAESA
jgi:sulfite dehydrogenase (quinone) subunit SoeC